MRSSKELKIHLYYKWVSTHLKPVTLYKISLSHVHRKFANLVENEMQSEDVIYNVILYSYMDREQ